MKLLLDTHVWMWLLESPQRLTPPLLRQIEEAESLVLSAVCIWEIALKTQIGKLQLKLTPVALRDEVLSALSATELPISATHALAACALPPIHKDPFDRLLVAQAATEELTLVTADDVVRKYPGTVLWAG